MWTLILCGMILLAALAGLKSGYSKSGKAAVTVFAGAYFPVWTLPAALIPVQKYASFIPAKYAPFTTAAVLLLGFIIVIAISAVIWKLVTRAVVAFDTVMETMPKLNRILGTAWGAAAGFALSSILLIMLATLPVSLPQRENLRSCAANTVLRSAVIVNSFSSDGENFSKNQREYINSLTVLPENSEKEKEKDVPARCQ